MSEPAERGPLRVVIVDDHAMFRAGVRHEIGAHCQVVGEGEDVATAVAAIVDTEPDVVLLDVHLPGGGGAEVIRQVLPLRPQVKFLALSVSDAAQDVIGVIRAGARGYVTKSISSDELLEGMTRVAAGEVSESELLRWYSTLVYVRCGNNYAEVARRLGIDRRTVAQRVDHTLAEDIRRCVPSE